VTQGARQSTGAAGDLAFRLLRLGVDVRRSELAALAWSWLHIFALLCANHIIRPMRDQMAVAGGIENLPLLFTATLIVVILLDLPFAYLVKTMPRSRFIPLTYRFFAATILCFALALHLADARQTIWVGRAFYIWISVSSLFVLSVYWALIADLFTSEQGKRLFGFIAAGATAGAITGSSLMTVLARQVGPVYLLIGATLLLEVAVGSMRGLSRLPEGAKLDSGKPPAEALIGGNLLAGVTHTFSNPYLVHTACFMLLYAMTSTLLYLQQAHLVSVNFGERGAQTMFFAKVDLVVNVLTLVMQLFVVGYAQRLLRVSMTLALLPALSIMGFGAMSLVPTIAALVVFQVARRAGNYAVARPTREALFTVVAREDRYKAKAFIDTVVYRLGDQIGIWCQPLITGMGWGLIEMSLLGAGISAVWLVNSLRLGRHHERIVQAASQVTASSEERPRRA